MTFIIASLNDKQPHTLSIMHSKKQEGQHPLTGQRAPPISVGAGLIGDLGL